MSINSDGSGNSADPDPAPDPAPAPEPAPEPAPAPALDPDQLIAAGRHPEAAARYADRGDHAAAARVYEKLWDWPAAARAAHAAGDLPRALRHALEAGDAPLTAEVLTALTADDDGARRALEVLVRMRRHAAAAPIALGLGDREQAIELYTRAHQPLAAAGLLEELGRDRDAGRLLERALELASGDERPPMQVALGRILARRAAYPEATRLLQDARKHAAHRPEALRHLIATLAAMGLRDGARDVLLELRALAPEVPADLDGYLRGWRDATADRRTGRDRELIGGRYRLERLLGAGGSGRVFLAADEVTGRQVAIKMFFAVEARGGAAYERFVREAKLASTLRHPSLVEVYDVSVDRGYLVMEYLAGGSLAQRLAAGDRPGGHEVRRMALELIAGLEAAHHRGVVHRDVKPANVFFDARGTAKLGDFGVAHLVDLGQTQTGGLIGTLAYMAPEQITGAPISIAADLYALGVTLFEAVTGRLPFLGPDFVAQHLGEPAPVATAVATTAIAPAWDPLLDALLAKNPRDRTATLAELRAVLEGLDPGGRAVLAPRRRRDSRPYSVAALSADDPDAPDAAGRRAAGPRYQFETPLGQTALSSLARAVDTVLDRSVVIERFDGSDEAVAAVERVRLLGRVQSPFVQRALALDRTTRLVTAVFEAPAGAAVADARPRLGAVDALRLLKRLARAAAAIHELGGSHGALSARTVMLDDGAVPTVLAAGLGPALPATPADDVAAIVTLVADLLGARPTFADLAATAAKEVGATVPPTAPAVDGESLYAAADAVDVAILAALGAR